MAKIKPINRDRKALAKNEKALAKGVHGIFQDQLKKITAALAKFQKDIRITDDPLDGIKWVGWEEFNDLFGTSIALSARSGVGEAYAQLDLDNPETLSLANQGAIEYAQNRAAELVGKQINAAGEIVENPNSQYSIDEATREFIRSDVTQAMEEGWSNDELAAKLEENYAFSEQRAETIARTETAFADTQGNMVLYRESEIVESKQWIVGADCCPECAELADEIVGLEENFSDGSECPPAHPNCRCDFIPILTEQTETQEEQ